jgi:RNA polymerase sigma factor (sigma-70 family)
MPPPPAEPLASRIFLGPALRTQPDRRLVKLVREGYEGAFEEIVRRYRRPLDRFAAAIVGNRSEDVTQDAFSKALLALRGTEAEIELRPWLYRIVRNTALNDLRDAPPAVEELGEAVAGGQSAAVEAERREEIAELMERLRALPEAQRAAIVMRELEGLSHEEIAAALGISGGAARQAIHRARIALRNGLGLLVPVPLLRVLFDHGAEAAAAGAGGAAAAAGVATSAGGGGAALGGLGAGGALKAGAATVLVAGSVGAGVAIQQNRDGKAPEPAAASAAQVPGGEAAGAGGSAGNSGPGAAGESGDDGADSGSGSSGDDRGGGDDRERGERGGTEDRDDSSGRGRGRGGDDDSSGSSSSGPGDRDDDSGRRTSGGSSAGPGSGDDDGRDRSNSGSGSANSGPGSGSSGPGSGSATAPSPSIEPDDDDSSGSGSGGSGSPDDDSGSSGSGGDGSGSSGSGSGDGG